MKDNAYLKLALWLLGVFCVVLLVIGSPVAAELSGRAVQERELYRAKEERKELRKEVNALRILLLEQISKTNQRAADIEIAISKLDGKASQAFRDTSWLKDWIAASKRK